MEYHYRVSVECREACDEVVDSFLKVFSADLVSYAIGYELVVAPNIHNSAGKHSLSDERFTQNHHMHFYLEYSKYSEDAFSKRRTRLLKQLKERKIVPDVNGAQYHEKQNKTRFENLRYCLKGKDIIRHNITDDELEEVKNDNERIELEKKQPII